MYCCVVEISHFSRGWFTLVWYQLTVFSIMNSLNWSKWQIVIYSSFPLAEWSRKCAKFPNHHESFLGWSWFPDFSFKSDILKLAGLVEDGLKYPSFGSMWRKSQDFQDIFRVLVHGPLSSLHINMPSQWHIWLIYLVAPLKNGFW